jgi:hypothetical protein
MKTKGIGSWIFVPKMDRKYNQWSIKLEISKAEADKLRAVGLKVNNEVIEDENGEQRIALTRRFTRNLINKSTKEENEAPFCVDAGKNPFLGNRCGIGNGSEVIVLHRPFKWDNDFGKGVGSDLKGVQILKLIPYEYTTSDVDSIDDGDDEFEVVGEGLVEVDEQFKDESTGSKEDIPY